MDKLPRGRNQAFYTILVESNGNVLTSYTAEEDLRRLAPGEATEVNHPEVHACFYPYISTLPRVAEGPRMQLAFTQQIIRFRCSIE